MATDEELVEPIIDDVKPRDDIMSEWTPEREGLAYIYDGLMSLISITVRANGGDPGEPPSFPRPTTAVEVVRARREMDRYRNLVERLVPKRR